MIYALLSCRNDDNETILAGFSLVRIRRMPVGFRGFGRRSHYGCTSATDAWSIAWGESIQMETHAHQLCTILQLNTTISKLHLNLSRHLVPRTRLTFDLNLEFFKGHVFSWYRSKTFKEMITGDIQLSPEVSTSDHTPSEHSSYCAVGLARPFRLSAEGNFNILRLTADNSRTIFVFLKQNTRLEFEFESLSLLQLNSKLRTTLSSYN